MRSTRLLPALTVAALLLSACARWPADRTTACVAPETRPSIATSNDGRERSTTLSVLIYNVEGLPWPARRNRGPWLDRIGDELARMRAAGRAPDIVLMQEAFTPRGGRIGITAGYANRVRGPSAEDMPADGAASDAHIAARRFAKGERLGKPLNSGLYILSDYPVVAVERQGFSRHACAGFDCLAAKGVMLARVRIPGVPGAVDIMTTHMNSQERSARVARERTLDAHRFQTIESARFLDRVHDSTQPLIFGGDFNMRQSPDRLDFFQTLQPYAIVRQWCTQRPGACDIRMSWDGDAPWLDTQDLQAFDDGDTVRVRPVRVEAVFDGPQTGGKLSDHDGYLVTYRLSWPAAAAGATVATCRRSDRP